jgi:hypothetical protein
MSNFKINLELEKLKEMGFDETLSSIIAYGKNNKTDEALNYIQSIKDEHEFLEQQIRDLGFQPVQPNTNTQGQFLIKN